MLFLFLGEARWGKWGTFSFTLPPLRVRGTREGERRIMSLLVKFSKTGTKPVRIA